MIRKRGIRERLSERCGKESKRCGGERESEFEGGRCFCLRENEFDGEGGVFFWEMFLIFVLIVREITRFV